MELVLTDMCAQYSLKLAGKLVLHSTVRLGSGAGPSVSSVCRMRKLDLVTRVRPSMPMPPMASVTQTGSPLNSWSYSGVRRKRTMRSFITKWSMISWTSSSVRSPCFRSRWK